MYYLFALLVTIVCMIGYSWMHQQINALVLSIRTPWLRISISLTLKLLALLATITVWLLTVFLMAMYDRGRQQRKP